MDKEIVKSIEMEVPDRGAPDGRRRVVAYTLGETREFKPGGGDKIKLRISRIEIDRKETYATAKIYGIDEATGTLKPFFEHGGTAFTVAYDVMEPSHA